MSTSIGRAETDAWLTLLRTPGLGANLLRELVERSGSATAAIEHARGDRALPPEARAWLKAPDEPALEGDRAWLAEGNRHLLVWTSADYPALLRTIASAPAALFVVGDPDWLWSPQLAVVGSRNASTAGLANARSFAKALAQAGIVVTSGLAEGIDGAAHAAALDAGGASIAVLGTGPDLVYPRQHRDLAARIAAHGALVAEFPPGTPGKPEHFPRRNRIIAGLSLGTLVVEASLKSGSLITARLAAEQGREVFAIPGSIHNPLARGCHRLIRDGAKLIETSAEVLEELTALAASLGDSLRARLAPGAPTSGSDAPPGTPPRDRSDDPEYARLLTMLDHEPASLDELIARTGLGAAVLSSMLLVLELEGAVLAAGGGKYLRAT